jgi:hypothetical protein
MLRKLVGQAPKSQVGHPPQDNCALKRGKSLVPAGKPGKRRIPPQLSPENRAVSILIVWPNEIIAFRGKLSFIRFNGI